jgi:hypothetical protein
MTAELSHITYYRSTNIISLWVKAMGVALTIRTTNV